MLLQHFILVFDLGDLYDVWDLLGKKGLQPSKGFLAQQPNSSCPYANELDPNPSKTALFEVFQVLSIGFTASVLGLPAMIALPVFIGLARFLVLSFQWIARSSNLGSARLRRGFLCPIGLWDCRRGFCGLALMRRSGRSIFLPLQWLSINAYPSTTTDAPSTGWSSYPIGSTLSIPSPSAASWYYPYERFPAYVSLPQAVHSSLPPHRNYTSAHCNRHLAPRVSVPTTSGYLWLVHTHLLAS